jgi:hypothetical protein
MDWYARQERPPNDQELFLLQTHRQGFAVRDVVERMMEAVANRIQVSTYKMAYKWGSEREVR